MRMDNDNLNALMTIGSSVCKNAGRERAMSKGLRVEGPSGSVAGGIQHCDGGLRPHLEIWRMGSRPLTQRLSRHGRFVPSFLPFGYAPRVLHKHHNLALHMEQLRRHGRRFRFIMRKQG